MTGFKQQRWRSPEHSLFPTRNDASYAKQPLSLADLSFLLWCTQEVKRVQGTYATFRTVPFAGARHAIETYPLVNNVEGLGEGLYRYLALSHRLEQLSTDPTLAPPGD